MAMPEMLKNFNLSVDGRGYAGIVSEATPPKLTMKTDEHRGGGMDAPIDIDMGMEKLEMEFKLSEYTGDMLKTFGVAQGGGVQFTLRGALQRDGDPVTPVVINMRGVVTEIDEGTWKAGEKSEMSMKVSLRYYKRTQGGELLHEIDVENMIRIIGGVDQLAEQRAALGI